MQSTLSKQGHDNKMFKRKSYPPFTGCDLKHLFIDNVKEMKLTGADVFWHFPLTCGVCNFLVLRFVLAELTIHQVSDEVAGVGNEAPNHLKMDFLSYSMTL